MILQVHEKKLNRQLEGIERWKNAVALGLSSKNGWGTFWWQTGVGKTYAACIIINKILTKNNASKCLIVVPNPELRKQWQSVVNHNIAVENHGNITIYTIGELMKGFDEGLQYITDLVIYDELHKYYTPERLKVFHFIIAKWGLGLTADYEDKEHRQKSIEYLLPIVDRIDEQEALREGYISKYTEYNLAVSLNEVEKKQYKELSDIITANLSKFGRLGLRGAQEVLEGMEAAYKYAAIQGWNSNLAKDHPINQMYNPHKILGYAKNAMSSIHGRKKLLYFSQNKLILALKILVKFPELKTIIFGQSTVLADVIYNAIKKYNKDNNIEREIIVYHSALQTVIVEEDGKQIKKGKTILKREAVEKFKKSKNGVLSTARSLDEGLDVPDIRLCLTTSGTQNPTQYNQRKGRGVRVENYEEDINVLIINLYIKGTQDEQWLKKRQSKSKATIYWIDSVDDINYQIKQEKEEEV